MGRVNTMWEPCLFLRRPLVPLKKVANGDIWFFTERDWSQGCCHGNYIVSGISFLLWCTFLVPNLENTAPIFFNTKTWIQYCSNVNWQSLKARYSKLDSWFSKTSRIGAQVEFRDVRGHSRISEGHSRIYRSSRVSRHANGKNKGLFTQLTFDSLNLKGRHILAIDLFWLQVHKT